MRSQLQLQTYASAATASEDDWHDAEEDDEQLEAVGDVEQRLRSKLHRHFQQFRSEDFGSVLASTTTL